ncbi:hypothetical protein ACIA7S_28700 [Streptomyces sp. NPDC051643]|uniref:hypothetical protein n=1 Tax=Streptomyces sp. NPDC051643 TaxID=3365665 RepID=UPI0037B550D6
MRNLRKLTDDQLCTMYGTADEATQDAIRRECDRRDHLDRKRAHVKARWDAAVAEWLDYAHAQWLAAEQACRGHLLSKAGHSAGIDPRDLWTGTTARAARYASEELLDFWAVSPRITRTQYVDLLAAARRAERTPRAS